MDRRGFLASGAACCTAAVASGWRAAAARVPGNRLFVLVVLRGGMDGLSVVVPHADPDHAEKRGRLAFGPPGGKDGLIDLDGRFGLHPALGALEPLWRSGTMAAVHAVASPYRDRSHFDAQAVLENGTDGPGAARDGWLGRAVRGAGGRFAGVAVGGAVPLVLQGDPKAQLWRPEEGDGPDAALVALVARGYRDHPRFAAALEAGAETARLAGGDGGRAPETVAAAVARLMTRPDGPSVAVLDAGGWDTHAGQGTAEGRLAGALGQLARGLTALREGLGEAWSRTVVMAVSEFGRTVAPNGAGGTDHGTGGVALLLGGAVAGTGRVTGPWPGLSTRALFAGRDLAPETDVRSLFRAVLSDHLRLPDRTIDGEVFPGVPVRPFQTLIRS